MKEKGRKIKEFVNKYYPILIPVCLIVVMILVFAIYNIHKLYTNYTTTEEDSFFQYFAGQKVTYKADLKLNRDKEVVDFTFKDKELELSSMPVYYQSDNADIIKVLFPMNMNLVMIENNYAQYKVINYATLTWDKANTSYILKTDDYDGNLSNSFFFDGVDLYFFMNEVTLTINDEEIDLGPMSIVKVNPRNSLEYYDYQSDKYVIRDITNETIIAYNKGFSVNLTEDKVNKFNDFVLLISPEYLNKLEMQED